LFVEYAEAFEKSEVLLHFLRTHFSTLTVLGVNQNQGKIPPFCNLLAVP
jgi:hypothetical protein